MSPPEYIIVPLTVYADQLIGSAAKLLYGRLKLYAGRDGRAYPKHETLGAEIGLAVRQVRHVLMELRAAGWIDWTRTRTSCVYTVFSDRQKSADQARQDIADLVAEKCRSRSAEKCRQKRSIENHHQKRGSEKKPRSSVDGSGVVEPQPETPKPISLKADDEKPQRPAGLTPEQDFIWRLGERHNGTLDKNQVLADVLMELGDTPFTAFLEADTTATTAPESLRNPHGHYRKLARTVARKADAAGLAAALEVRERAREWMAQAEQPAPTVERCDHCHQERGKGTLMEGGTMAPCPVCATPEWAETVRRVAERDAQRRADKVATP